MKFATVVLCAKLDVTEYHYVGNIQANLCVNVNVNNTQHDSMADRVYLTLLSQIYQSQICPVTKCRPRVSIRLFRNDIFSNIDLRRIVTVSNNMFMGSTAMIGLEVDKVIY